MELPHRVQKWCPELNNLIGLGLVQVWANIQGSRSPIERWLEKYQHMILSVSIAYLAGKKG